MVWGFVSKNVQRVIKFGLLDMAVGSQVATCSIVLEEVMLCQEALGACVVSGGKMDLSKEEGIISIVL